MLYLADDISRKNQLSLITGNWDAWTGTNYFNLNGQLDESITPDMKAEYLDEPFGLFSLILSEITPMNIADIPAEDILQFCLKRADEINSKVKQLSEAKKVIKKVLT